MRSLLITVFALFFAFQADGRVKYNARIIFETIIFKDFKRTRELDILHEGQKVRVSENSKDGIHRVLYIKNGAKKKGYIHVDEFEFIKFNIKRKKKRPRVAKKATDRQIYDLMFFPYEGIATLIPKLQLRLTDESNKTPASLAEIYNIVENIAFTEKTETKRKEFISSLYAAYSFSDRFYGEVGVRYAVIDTVSINSPDGSLEPITRKSDGIYDPDVTIKVRLINGDRSWFDLDILLNIIPDLIGAKAPSDQSLGIESKGGHEMRPGIVFGKRFKKHQAAIEASYILYDRGQIAGQDGFSDQEVSGGDTLSLDFAYLWAPIRVLQLEPHFKFLKISDQEFRHKTAQVAMLKEGYTSMGLNLGVNFITISGRMMLFLKGEYNILSETFMRNSLYPSLQTKITSRKAVGGTLGCKFLF